MFFSFVCKQSFPVFQVDTTLVTFYLVRSLLVSSYMASFGFIGAVFAFHHHFLCSYLMTSAVISQLYLVWEEFSTLITSFLRFFMNVTVIFQFSFCGKVFRANWTAKCQVFHLCLSTHNWRTNWFLIPRTHNWSTNWFLNEWMNSHFRPWIVLIPRNDLQPRTWSESFFLLKNQANAILSQIRSQIIS